MRAPVRPMGCGSVRFTRTLVRISAHPRGQYVVRPAGETLRPHAELIQETNLDAAAAPVAGSVQGRGHYVLPCGAQDPSGVRAPGSLTGDCPDARERARQRRIR